MPGYLTDTSGLRSKSNKLAENSQVSIESNSGISRISTGYQSGINASCTPDIMSCHPLLKMPKEPVPLG